MGYKPFECDKCDKAFTSYGKRWEHNAIEHTKDYVKRIISEPKEFVCKYLKPVGGNEEGSEEGKEGTEEKAELCLEVFKSLIELKDH